MPRASANSYKASNDRGELIKSVISQKDMMNPGSKKPKNQAYQSNMYEPSSKKQHKKTKSLGTTPVAGSNFNLNFY